MKTTVPNNGSSNGSTGNGPNSVSTNTENPSSTAAKNIVNVY